MGRYALCVVLAGVAFIALALIEEQSALLALFGGHDAVPNEGPREVHVAETAVRAFNEALEAAYRGGDLAALPEALVAPAVRAQLVKELEFRREVGQGAPHTLTAFEVLVIESTGEKGWSVVTEESWATEGGGPAAGRVRFRYTLAARGDAWQVTEISPVAPGRSP